MSVLCRRVSVFSVVFLFLALTVTVCGQGTLEAALISPVGSLAEHNRDNSNSPGVRGASGNTIDGSGFTGNVVTVAEDPNDSHNTPTNIWYVKPSEQAGANPPEIFYYDLGSSLPLESVVLWNQNGSGGTGGVRDQAEIGPITQVSVATTTGSPGNFTLGDMGALGWTPGITSQAVSTTVGAGQTFDFGSPVDSQYLRLTIDAAQQGNNGQYAFNEFAVLADVPAPPVQETIFDAPPGGWSYMYIANPGEDNPAVGNALDGTWDHDNGSDEWDGSAIGAGRPGGAQVITPDPDSYLRIQDTGDPRDHGMGDPGSNRKVGFTKDIRPLIPDGHDILDDGVTMTFRARLATDGPLDDVHPDGGGATAPWPAGGDGYLIHDGGKGLFGIHQEEGDDQTISFSLALDSDHGSLSQAGLVMNSLNGTSRSGDVDTGEGTNNQLVIADPTAFHEFWVTVKGDTSGGGTHRVDVYMDGATTPDTFHVTSGTGEDEGRDYLALYQGATGQSGAADIDFYGFRVGAWAPGDTGLVAYYNFDGNTNDHSGHDLHGTAQGDAAFNSDVPTQIGGGQSMSFDGDGDFVDLGNPGELDFGVGDWTVSGWVKTTQSGGSNRGTLYSNGGDGGGGVRTVLTQNEQSDGTLSLTVDDDSDKIQAETDSDTNDGQWHHIVGIRQGRAIAVYVDGELQDSNDLPGGYDLSETSQQPAHIGATRQQSDSSLIKELVGQIDDVAIWRLTLPHSVIQGLADGTYNPLTAPTTALPPDVLPADAELSDFLNIDIGPSGQRVEPGFVGLPGAPGNNTGGTNLPAATLIAATGDAITFTLDNVDQNGSSVGGIDWRDRGDSDNDGVSLVLVGEDHIKNNSGVIRATLEGIPEGDYLVEAYFVDAENSQSEAIEIYLTDAAGTSVLQDVLGDASFPGGNPGGSGEDALTTNLMDAHSAAFLMTSDGSNPIQIVFNGSLASDDEMPLSGLAIHSVTAAVPEPSTLILAILGLAGLAVFRRRRRALL